MLATRFLQAGKGVATLPPGIISRPATDLTPLHMFPDLAFTEINVDQKSEFTCCNTRGNLTRQPELNTSGVLLFYEFRRLP
ncbi:hypothetical protein [Endozoicomonas euniceicola]|uniref:Uncharacterized protein n=1 Tax=Endozoicomonas euniceicola TaxID=1234143 RepID=A0ABY6GXX3_9GAMM|nr:hypothetical protein [Endozoicomonas euniceicola]UYM17643.1 hypothetical protein NX720_06975 [Endozoicomonas euniceicola]